MVQYFLLLLEPIQHCSKRNLSKKAVRQTPEQTLEVELLRNYPKDFEKMIASGMLMKHFPNLQKDEPGSLPERIPLYDLSLNRSALSRCLFVSNMFACIFQCSFFEVMSWMPRWVLKFSSASAACALGWWKSLANMTTASSVRSSPSDAQSMESVEWY